MRNLIRKILKEEFHNDEDMIHKGIDILISLLRKKYPFIVGWRPDGKDTYDKEWSIVIHLVVSASKAKEYYDMDYKTYYVNYPDSLEEEVFTGERDYAYPVSLFDYESVGFEPYENNREISSFAEEMYELIPEEYKAKEDRVYTYSNEPYIHIKDIRINSYYFVA
jgi:hypothetical protein